MKAAAYAGTPNLYSEMVTAAKSLAINSSVDMIYFVIDGPEFPEKLPDYIQCIDASKQEYFTSKCPNIYKSWTYMVLMRATYAYLFPDLDRILSLDVDTIVDQNIDDLWDLDLDGYFMAAVKEPKKSKDGPLYVNVGVTMFNLDMIRAKKMHHKFVRALNFKKFRWAEQDCMNDLCKGYILPIPYEYDSNNYTQPCIHNEMPKDDTYKREGMGFCENPKVIHFANEANRTERPIYLKYRDIPWEKIRK